MRNKKKLLIFLLLPYLLVAQVTLEKEVKITDLAIYFDGVKNLNSTNQSATPYDYAYGRTLSPHGDCIKTYKQYVFMTWYRGGKLDRHMMLTRYNTQTGTMKTIEFPHQHTGFNGKWWIGETHNTIAIGISPINGTIHMVFDMHAYNNSGVFKNDYFRYSYSIKGAADLPDEDFTLDKFIKDPIDNDYKHCTMDGVRDPAHYNRFTYPEFFLNDNDELFLKLRKGSSHDGALAFIKYDSASEKWGRFKYFNALGAGAKGETHNWSIYGSIKYVDGKIRIGFQRRLHNGADKYLYQNGVYYAYSDDPSGATQWKNYKGEEITSPLVKAEEVLIYEPGDYVQTTKQNQVYIVGSFDWTVTDNGDVHIISKVRDTENNITKSIHSYQPNGTGEFVISEDFNGASELYTSGDKVFVIGLNASGRPFVDRADGGTNKFTRVYEQTTGKRFQKGQVYISNGKLYYYLLENNASDTDDTQPTYLQIIDLDIAPTDPTLPNNFTIQAIGETCINKDNGTLIITSAATHNYLAIIDGVSYDFTKNKTIEGLRPGTYDLCIDVVGKNYKHCYQVTIEAAESLSGKISVNKKSAIISVQSGKAPYKVIKNGQEVLETYQTDFSIDVNDGDNIQIKSKEACQGEMVKTINLLQSLRAYPNPTSGLFEIDIPSSIDNVDLEVYNIQSQLIVSKTYIPNAGKVKLNLKNKPNGIYFVKVNIKQPVFVKVIKK